MLLHMSWHCIFLYIDTAVSQTNSMFGNYSDRIYLFQLEINISDRWVLQTNKAFNGHRDHLNKYRFMIIFDKSSTRWTCSKISYQL